jgi:hypothetical protein
MIGRARCWRVRRLNKADSSRDCLRHHVLCCSRRRSRLRRFGRLRRPHPCPLQHQRRRLLRVICSGVRCAYTANNEQIASDIVHYATHAEGGGFNAWPPLHRPQPRSSQRQQGHGEPDDTQFAAGIKLVTQNLLRCVYYASRAG